MAGRCGGVATEVAGVGVHGLSDTEPEPEPEAMDGAMEGARASLDGLKLAELKAIAEAEGLKLRGIPW